ncbi:hypothetical protein ACH35V_15255 [Actinomadura sp. 1N219]|uniref:hypothetical protein n=1 Tax=Actinomadura sp. 1N219 TaxID=3375152 RepID=UPI0037A32598
MRWPSATLVPSLSLAAAAAAGLVVAIPATAAAVDAAAPPTYTCESLAVPRAFPLPFVVGRNCAASHGAPTSGEVQGPVRIISNEEVSFTCNRANLDEYPERVRGYAGCE